MKKILAMMAVAGLTTVASAQPGTFIDLGVIGGEGDYTFDTFGSTWDTELGLWDNSGVVLAQNDDFGGLQSQVGPITLTAGMYWLGVSEFNSFFVDGWMNTGTAFEGGDDALAILNINGVFASSQMAGAGLDQETAFWKVTVVPAPGSLALLGLGGLVAARRRRA